MYIPYVMWFRLPYILTSRITDTGTIIRALEATGSDDVVVSPLEAEHVALDLVPPGAEPALEATEEISVMVPAVDVPAVDGQSVEGSGGETIERRSLTSTATVSDCDGDFFKLPNMTAELTPSLQLSGGYLNCNALCILLGLPLSNSGHY